MQDKRERILAAATDLFHEHGFEGVTTQEISDRADVAAGTLFRYASSKSELFLMVYNEQLRSAIADGAHRARRETDVSHAVCALVEPIMVAATGRDSAVVYQRELLFGSPDEQYRAEGLALVAGLEDAVADRLVVAVLTARGTETVDPMLRQAAMRAARSVFAVLNLLLVQPCTSAHPGSDVREELREQTAQIVRGLLVTVDERP
ncbi:TetR/AcrR family transcriptional regulator [Sanguibacter antarcticus]|nr:TetR/AcrR family transcriptional regulator [Sanguibacter antarcticus]